MSVIVCGRCLVSHRFKRFSPNNNPVSRPVLEFSRNMMMSLTNEVLYRYWIASINRFLLGSIMCIGKLMIANSNNPTIRFQKSHHQISESFREIFLEKKIREIFIIWHPIIQIGFHHLVVGFPHGPVESYPGLVESYVD
jgi:hypothetical protein